LIRHNHTVDRSGKDRVKYRAVFHGVGHLLFLCASLPNAVPLAQVSIDKDQWEGDIICQNSRHPN
jgi:hypothetical protein